MPKIRTAIWLCLILSPGLFALAEVSPEDLFRAPVVYRLPGMQAVRVDRNVVYQEAEGKPLAADVYLPREGNRFPVVIFIHGGFPEGIDISGKDSGQYQSWGRLIAASGMAAIAFNHRMRMSSAGAVHLSESASDLRALIGWMRSHADEHSLDPSRFAAFAVSAGGPLLPATLGEPGLRCLVDYYGFLDVRGHDWFARALAVTPGVSWSLTEQLERGRALPPIFVARAGRDKVPQMKETIDRFVARALVADAPLTLVNHPTGQHAFDIQDDDARTREIIEFTLRFLRDNLISPAPQVSNTSR